MIFKRGFGRVLALILLIGLATPPLWSCGGAGDDDDDTEITDDDDDQEPEPLPPYLVDRPDLTDWSLWKGTYLYDAPIPMRRIGGFGLGNGSVFSFVAARVPFTTLHNLIGPNYERHLKFFSDKVFTLRSHGEPVLWEKEHSYRVRKTAVNLVHQEKSNLSLWTVDFAPRGEGIDGTSVADTLVRMIVVHNRGDNTASGLSVAVDTIMGEARDSMIFETNPDDGRNLVGGFTLPGAAVNKKGNGLVLDLAPVAPGDQKVVGFLFAFALEESALWLWNYASALDPDVLLGATLASWKDFTDRGTGIKTGNERFNDLIEGMSVTIGVQQAKTGGVSQMSEYTGTWLRDIMGPARFFPLIGRADEYKRMIDYYWLAVLERGDISNSMALDIELEELPEQPDWENKPTMSGRLVAEGPSYLILHYKAYLEATGDWSPLEERYGMLRHALIHQDLREQCLLPFSDDETFRIAMAVAFGHSVFNNYQETYLSANSSFLFVAAAEFMTQVARHLGFDDHAAQYQQLAEEVRACTERYYWLPDRGTYSPFLDIDTLEPDPRPFEDVNTKPLWIGYLRPDDPKAESNLLGMMALIGQEDGLLYTPIHPSYRYIASILDVFKGAITGMNYGYYLDNLARIDHPMAETAFLVYDRMFHDSGNVSEGMVIDDFGRFEYLYEPLGYLCDLTARYRSWEGGINAGAMIQYLFGLELDAPDSRIAVAPHLPEGWGFAKMEGVRIGEDRFDLLVEDDGLVRRVSVEGLSGGLTVDAVVSVEGSIFGVSVNGQAVAPPILSKWGRSRAYLNGLEAGSNRPLIIEVTRAGS